MQGEVAMAMMEGAKKAIGHNVPEYEIAIAQSQAGTRKAAELLKTHYNNINMSPNIHFLPVITSGKDLPRTHHRASTKLIQRGDPVFLCYCGSTNFHRFKLGFDRIFWVEEIRDKDQIKAFEVAVKSQQAALNVLRSWSYGRRSACSLRRYYTIRRLSLSNISMWSRNWF